MWKERVQSYGDAPLNPLTSYKEFFEACYLLGDEGYQFEFVSLGTLVESKRGCARANAIWWQSPMTSYWDAFSVIHRAFFRVSSESWLPNTLAREAIGVPSRPFRELRLAICEGPGHSMSLRQRLLEVFELTEVPIKHRPSYKRHEQ